jgi:hypothetical protein
MKISLELIKRQMEEIDTKIRLLGIEIDSIRIDYPASYSRNLIICLWTGHDFIYNANNSIYMSISDFASWYKHKQILLRKF